LNRFLGLFMTDSSTEFIPSGVEWAPKKHIDLSQKKARPEVVIPTGVMRSIAQRRNLVSNDKDVDNCQPDSSASLGMTDAEPGFRS